MLSLDALVTGDVQGPSVQDVKAILKLLADGTAGILPAAYVHSTERLLEDSDETAQIPEDWEGVKIVVADGGGTIGGWKAGEGRAHCFVFERSEDACNIPTGLLRVGEMIFDDEEWFAEKILVLELPRDLVLFEGDGYGLLARMYSVSELEEGKVDDDVAYEDADVLNCWTEVLAHVIRNEDALDAVSELFSLIDGAVQGHLSGMGKMPFVVCESQAMVEVMRREMASLFGDDRVLALRNEAATDPLWLQEVANSGVYVVLVGLEVHVTPAVHAATQVFVVVDAFEAVV